jgi:hypothetical protein
MSVDRSTIPPGADADEVIDVIQSLQDRVDDLEAGYQQQADRISALEEENDHLREQLQEERRDRREAIDALHQTVEDVQSTIEDEDVDLDGKTTLEKYAAMPPDVREETLGPSDRRAVALLDHWHELAKQTNKGQVISTSRNPHKKNSPSDLKPALSNIVDEDLAWTEVYRAMKALAKLAGGEHMVDEFDREHVDGGAIEFHEMPTPDGNQTKKRLVCVDESVLEGDR